MRRSLPPVTLLCGARVLKRIVFLTFAVTEFAADCGCVARLTPPPPADERFRVTVVFVRVSVKVPAPPPLAIVATPPPTVRVLLRVTIEFVRATVQLAS